MAMNSTAPVDGIHWRVAAAQRRWLVTGAAGFIGSHLVEHLLAAGQSVVGLDDFSTGNRSNLDQVRSHVGEEAWQRWSFIEGSIVERAACREACAGVGIVLHQAALGSVPRSLGDPLATHDANVTGFANMLVAARDAGVGRFVYAASSSTYGDDPGLPKFEDSIGEPLTPYALSKRINEMYAAVFARCYGFATMGLRYFNVFGARQDPSGPYAAVIPRWVDAMIGGEPCLIHGDGETSRDFCYVDNAVQANFLAALVEAPEAVNQVYNVAVGQRTTLTGLHELLSGAVRARRPDVVIAPPRHEAFRPGDVRHSQADISKAARLLGYRPSHDVASGLRDAVDWYLGNRSAR
jgi:UDP-N-acetylglucosamine 4-epimerase